MGPPQCRVVGSDGVLLATPGEDNERGVLENADHSPKLVNRVSVRVAMRRRVDVPGVRAGASGTLLLAVDYHVTGLKTGSHI
jgi:hypothetical protein